MKKFLIVLLVITTFKSFAQYQPADSLKRLLHTGMAYTNRIKLLVNLAD